MEKKGRSAEERDRERVRTFLLSVNEPAGLAWASQAQPKIIIKNSDILLILFSFVSLPNM
jgi:hypothetical protein